jgi:transposase InsO family protein
LSVFPGAFQYNTLKDEQDVLAVKKQGVQYLNERPHTALGYKTPVQFENQYFQGLSGEQLN